MNNDSTTVISRNIRLLMLERGAKYSDFDKRDIGIKGRMVRLVVQDGQAITVQKLDAVATFLGVKTCDLINPDMQLDSVTNGRLQTLITAFLTADNASKDFISTVIEREIK